MKFIFFVSFFLFTMSTFSQDIERKVTVWGFGDLVFYMSPRDVSALLDNVSTEKTKVSTKEKNGETIMTITNMKIIGYKFDKCVLTFGVYGLDFIQFSTKVSRKDRMFEELNSILKSDYGEPSFYIGYEADSKSVGWHFPNTDYISMTKDFYLNKFKIEIVLIAGFL